MRKLLSIVTIGIGFHILINILYYYIYVIFQGNSILDVIFVSFFILTLILTGVIQVVLIKKVDIRKSTKEWIDNLCYTLEKIITFISLIALVYLEIDIPKYAQNNVLFLLVYIIAFHSIIVIQIGLRFNKNDRF